MTIVGKRVRGVIVTGPPACGPVVDLRGDDGGIRVPMLAGSGVLPDDGIVATKGGRNRVSRRRVAAVSAVGGCLPRADPGGVADADNGARLPIALLIDGTGNTGGLTGIAFAGRAGTALTGPARA